MALPGLVRANNLSDVANKELAWNNLGNNFSATNYAPSPAFDANFAANKSLIDSISGSNLISFSRASTGTFVGSNGLIQTAASGVPRFDHNGATGESLGLLIEEARTNLRTASTVFSTGWGYSANVTVTPGQTSPTGDNTASLITLNTGTFNARLGEKFFFGSTVYTRSWFAKKTNQRYMWSGDQNNGNSAPFIRFDLDLGIATLIAGSGSYSITPCNNGYYRISVTCSSYDIFLITVNNNASSNPLPNPGGATFHDGTETFIIWGYQIEQASLPTSYIATSGSTVTRAADTCSIISPLYSASIFGQFIANNSTGQAIASINNNTTSELWETSASLGNVFTQVVSSGITRATVLIGTTTTQLTARTVSSLGANILTGSTNGQVAINSALLVPPVTTQITIGRTQAGTYYLNSTLSRLALWSSPLPPTAVRALSASGIGGSLTTYQSITGKDIAALSEVYKTSTRDFVFLRGLTSAIQPRITTASQNTTSGVSFSNTRLLDVSPSSIGNFFVASGSLNAQNLRVNGITVGSLSSVPFSGSTALFPLTISTMEMSSNFRFVPLFTSGVVSSPTIGVPVETNDFILYGKAGQS